MIHFNQIDLLNIMVQKVFPQRVMGIGGVFWKISKKNWDTRTSVSFVSILSLSTQLDLFTIPATTSLSIDNHRSHPGVQGLDRPG